jgi:hypothetical protein
MSDQNFGKAASDKLFFERFTSSHLFRPSKNRYSLCYVMERDPSTSAGRNCYILGKQKFASALAFEIDARE